jgi:tRNA nucleotidyltransferase (CCA-adding enzyme)
MFGNLMKNRKLSVRKMPVYQVNQQSFISCNNNRIQEPQMSDAKKPPGTATSPSSPVLPRLVEQVLLRLEAAGFDAYVVGGCVRDHLLRRLPQDWDVASSATPAQARELFSDLQVIGTGEKHGTLRLLGGGEFLELTSFRSDGSYSDQRRPDQVSFVSTIQQDLARRDFTANAIAYHPQRGFIDPFNGRGDIQARLLRAVGQPEERLGEDALRIMRALRFAAVLGFNIDARLDAGLHQQRALLKQVSAERLSTELSRMLVGEHILPVLLEYPDVLAELIPEIGAAVGFEQHTPYHCFDVWTHTAHAVAAAAPDARVRLTLLLHDLGKPGTFFIGEDGRGHFYGHDKLGQSIACQRLKALRFDRATVGAVAEAIHYHQVGLRPENMLRWLSRLGEPAIRLLLDVKRGDMAAHAPGIAAESIQWLDACQQALDDLIASRACFKRTDLAVNGDDLKGIGIRDGKEIGRLLQQLLDAVVNDGLENSRDALLAAAEGFAVDCG